jgi:hypothetical protein
VALHVALGGRSFWFILSPIFELFVLLRRLFPSLDLLNDLASLRILSNPISFLCSALVSAIELMQNAVFQVPVLAYPQLAVFRQSICWNTNEFALPGQRMPLQMPVSPSLSGLTPQGEETF